MFTTDIPNEPELSSRDAVVGRCKVITVEQLKTELDTIDPSLVDALYQIVVAMKRSDKGVITPEAMDSPGEQAEWQSFITRTYGSLSQSPIVREEQGEYEVREELS